MNFHAIEKTELNKILAIASEYCVLEGGRELLANLHPSSDIAEVRKLLAYTRECVKLLFTHGVSKIEHYPKLTDELQRARKGSALSCGELLSVGGLLRSIRIARTSIAAINDEEIVATKLLADKLYDNVSLEDDIGAKILNDTEVSDYASDKLYTLRREIRLLNEKIRARLAEYLSGAEGKFLQDGIITMRNNRYVLPVKAEYKRNVKGFIHDRSATGATFFIEPEAVLEMNNELRSLMIDEKEEVQRILSELTRRIGQIADSLEQGIAVLNEIDCLYAKAEYAYKTHSVLPQVNDCGEIVISRGRHPLIDPKKVVPVSLSLGKGYRFLLISGPNTGGKTVSLKMVGLFCLMAMVGLFVPANEATVSVFEEVYCDVGDAQSIEESLSTFSSHVKNVVEITERADKKSLVLIDELGGGTDPDEGQALAKAIVSHLIKTGCTGVLTTHYSALKEFAFATDGIENACMEFDSSTLQPLYVLKIGLPGSSNALAISRRLGLKESILEEALSSLSEGAQAFEHIVRSAEESRIAAEKALEETNRIKQEWQQKVEQVESERVRLQKEREKLFSTAKAESRRIINERSADAEELLSEIEKIFAKEHLAEKDLIAARTLKNRLSDLAYETQAEELSRPQYVPAKAEQLKVGDSVYVARINDVGVIQSIRLQKGEVEILCGNARLRVKISELSVPSGIPEKSVKKEKLPKWKKKASSVQVSKSLATKAMPMLELNVIGKTVLDAIPEVEAFLDAAVLANLEEVRIVHGMGTGKLRAGIHEYLRKAKNVAEFRLGRYGEGETGVTIVKIR